MLAEQLNASRRRCLVFRQGLVLLTLCSLTPVLAACNASAPLLTWNSVDGREIRYENRTQFDDAFNWGRDRWNEMGNITIAGDTVTTVADLEVADYSSDDGNCGFAQPESGSGDPDLVRFNAYYFNGNSTLQDRACATHELGHTLGLAHSWNEQVMDAQPTSYDPYVHDTPQNHDIAAYRDLWGLDR